MKVGIICPHSWPIPWKNRSGDVWMLDLAHGLARLGHDVTMFAPKETQWGKVVPMPCAFGQWPPTAQQCEQALLEHHAAELEAQDILHDCSVARLVATRYPQKSIVTHCGGGLDAPNPPRNIVAVSKAQRDRLLRGKNDYEGISPEMDRSVPVLPKDVHVVYHGIDTDFYCPDGYVKGGYWLWMGRWHPVRGYDLAIEIAKHTGIKLVMAGCHPDDEVSDYQRTVALEVAEKVKAAPNITLEWLPSGKEHHLRKRDLYRGAIALLYTVQFHEPFGLMQAEAMACGTPVIGTELGSCMEIAQYNTSREWNTVHWPQALSRMMFGADIGRYNNHRFDSWPAAQEAVRRTAVRRFSRHTMAANYVKEYERILAGETW